MRIVFVEDDEIDRLQLKRLFKGITDFELLFFENGEEAFSYFKNDWDNLETIIVSDLNMPKMDGLSLLKRIRAEKELEDLPFYLFVGNENDEHINEGVKYNLSGYLVKPLDLERFRRVLMN